MTTFKYSKKDSTSKSCLGSILFLCVAGFVILVAIVTNIPTAPKTSDEVAGVYTLEHNLAQGQLELRSNGSFVQTMVIRSDARKMVSEGVWSYRTDSYYGVRLGTIKIEDMLFVLNQSGELMPDEKIPWKARFVSPVWNVGGQVVIGEDSEEVVVWRKKRSDGGIHDGADSDIPTPQAKSNGTGVE